jgi:hypothetical protein
MVPNVYAKGKITKAKRMLRNALENPDVIIFSRTGSIDLPCNP